MPKKVKQLLKIGDKVLSIPQKDKHIRQFLEEIEIYYNSEKIFDKFVKEWANKEKYSSTFYELSLAYGLITHVPVVETVDKKYRPFLMQTIKDLEKEFSCNSPSDKILIENFASAYIRELMASETLLIVQKQMKSLNGLNSKAQYLSVLSKEVDRANRQRNTALQVLIQKKRAPVKLTVKANTAFIANQQINSIKNRRKSNDQH